MKITVKDPATGALWNMEAKSENYNGVRGYRILHDNDSGFFITNKSGTWQSGDDHHVEPDLLINIGLALEGHELGEQIINH